MKTFDTADQAGKSGLTPPMSDYIYNLVWNSVGLKTVTWPQGSSHCNIIAQTPGSLWASTGTAAAPSGDVLDGTGSALAIGQRRRSGNQQTFTLYSSVAQSASIEFWG